MKSEFYSIYSEKINHLYKTVTNFIFIIKTENYDIDEIKIAIFNKYHVS